jgi:DNA-binding beta-propeller fold protein YncE
MRRSRQTMALSRVGVLALAASVIATAELSPAAATDVAPLRVIKDQDPNFDTLWVDLVNDEILAGNDAQETLQVYSRSANGLVAPLREVKGEATFITYPGQVIVDPVHNEIWSVGNDIADLITVYSRTAVGNVAPIRRIDGKKSQLRFNRSWGIALDTANDELFATHQKRNQISVFARTMNTDTNPKATAKRTIQGPATGLTEPHGIYVDAKANEIYVANLGHKVVEDKATGLPVGSTAPPSITVYARTARGNAAPLRTIQGEKTQLDMAKPIFVDEGRHEIVVADGSPTDALLFFDQKANGNAAPIRVIHGSDTGLSNPTGVFVDAKHNEVLVANWSNHTITVYPRGAGGNVKPIRVISPTKSRVAVGMGNPGAIYVDPERDEIGVPN